MKIQQFDYAYPLDYLLAKEVSRFYGISIDDMLIKTRKTQVSRARHLYYFYKTETEPTISHTKLAGTFGQKHASVWCAIKGIKEQLDVDKKFKRELMEFMRNTKAKLTKGVVFIIGPDDINSKAYVDAAKDLSSLDYVPILPEKEDIKERVSEMLSCDKIYVIPEYEDETMHKKLIEIAINLDYNLVVPLRKTA